MKKYIKPVAIGLLLTGLLLTTGAIGVSGFGEKSAEAAENTEAAAVQSALSLLLLTGSSATETTLNYPIVDTGVSTYYSNNSLLTSAPATGEAFYGQDAHYNGNQPRIRITRTGL
ncbi:hypothetical protein H206_00800 [Candidatus Electrothrix aarhusensis]|uniref:Uncharacterized protein n=1 Tax=Candidatus Electrothrix aarhusensis TaxID=1859131 RepID=A0A3S3SMX3_9BACT|nr:hypothetical protein H206_00800 [Candidatus Electrothrix aarhusensis]